MEGLQRRQIRTGDLPRRSRDRGLLRADEGQLSDETRKRLREEELRRAGAFEAERSGRSQVTLSKGDQFEGKFEKTVDLASGRRALIGSETTFALVPWRPEMERHRGRSLIIEQKAKNLSWSFPSGRGRGLSR